ncbi:MAG: THxN family PEP-CTERM protein [Gammaproteobacteria bacterium]|nr:THxN family PEP-CTERM protein [Gammaproteobacteria bacterium]
MTFRTILCCIAATAALSPAWVLAVPITLVGAGTWNNVTPPNTVNLTGLGTNVLTWGTPLDQNSSGYTFAGNTVTVDPLDGTVFTVGTFTHNNFRISGSPTPASIQGATLLVDFNISNGVSVDRAFTFNFLHNETPNGANPCPFPFSHPNPGGGGCEDVVSLETVFSQEILGFGGQALKLEIIGFLTAGGTLVDQFLTAENASNSASIQARFTSSFPVANVPTPTSIALFGLGLSGLWLTAARKKNHFLCTG